VKTKITVAAIASGSFIYRLSENPRIVLF